MGGRSWSTELRSSSGMSSSGWGKLVTIGNPIVCADRHFMEEAKDGEGNDVTGLSSSGGGGGGGIVGGGGTT
jgi:hypothetical protein